MLGVAANTVSVIIGGLIGMLFSKLISEKYTKAIMSVVGLSIVYIGIDGALSGENSLVLIISLVLGTAFGTLLDIDGAITKLGKWVENTFKGKNSGNVSIAEGFVTASLLFCVGSMTIVGSLNAGISGDNTLLFIKAVLDMISACVLASSLGVGVVLSSAFVFVLQGSLVLAASLTGPFIPPDAQNELICAGSLMIIAIGLNMMGITKIKVANIMPALIFAPLLTHPFNQLTALIS